MHKLAIFLVAGIAVLAAGQPAAEAKDKTPPEYLALGDSIAAGEGTSDPASTAYVPLFHQFLQSKEGLKGEIDLLNLPTPGATTSGDVVLSQLPVALAELEARNGDTKTKNDVKVVTLSAGGYDLFAHILVCFDGPTEECVNAINDVRLLASVYLDLALNQLRQAAGPDTSIIVMTYSNALAHPDCELHFLESVWDLSLEGSASLGIPEGLNDVIRSLAASYGAHVAEVSGLLTPTELQSDCFNPNDAGHALIGQRFVEAFEN